MGQVIRWGLANRGRPVITSCLYCSISNNLMTMLLIIDNWPVALKLGKYGRRGRWAGPCRLQYMIMYEYRLWRW